MIGKIYSLSKKEKSGFFKTFRKYSLYNKTYGISFDEFKENKLYDASSKNGEKLAAAVRIAKIKNISVDRAHYKIKQVEKLLDISPREYFEKKYYNYTNFHLVQKLCSPTDDEVLEKIGWLLNLRLGISEEEAKERVLDISNRYNIPIRKVMYYGLYKCSDDLIENRLKISEKDYVERASKKYNVEYEVAENRLKEIESLFGLSYKIGLKYFNMTNEEIFAQRDKKDARTMKSLITQAKEANTTPKDFYYNRKLRMDVFGEWKETYRLFNLGAKPIETMNTFMLGADMRYLITKYNLNPSRKILDNKEEFANYFKEVYGRKFWINKEDSTYESFCEFLADRKYEDLIVKPINGIRGGGIKKIKVDNDKTKELYDELMKSEPVMVEECIVQHEVLRQFGGGSVNTIRILTIYDGGCNILYAVLRVGTGDVVDNFHSGGFVVAVNKDTGVIESNGASMKNSEIVRDPNTGKLLKGTQIPHWDKVIKLVEKSSEMIKEVGLVGWDIAITEDGPVLIEGNSNAMVALYECTFTEKNSGHRYLLKDFLDEKF